MPEKRHVFLGLPDLHAYLDCGNLNPPSTEQADEPGAVMSQFGGNRAIFGENNDFSLLIIGNLARFCERLRQDFR